MESLPSADEIIRRVIEGLRLNKPGSRAQKPDPLWVRVKKLAGYGSTFSQAICTKYGFSPDELWRPEL